MLEINIKKYSKEKITGKESGTIKHLSTKLFSKMKKKKKFQKTLKNLLKATTAKNISDSMHLIKSYKMLANNNKWTNLYATKKNGYKVKKLSHLLTR